MRKMLISLAAASLVAGGIAVGCNRNRDNEGDTNEPNGGDGVLIESSSQASPSANNLPTSRR